MRGKSWTLNSYWLIWENWKEKRFPIEQTINKKCPSFNLTIFMYQVYNKFQSLLRPRLTPQVKNSDFSLNWLTSDLTSAPSWTTLSTQHPNSLTLRTSNNKFLFSNFSTLVEKMGEKERKIDNKKKLKWWLNKRNDGEKSH